MTVLLPRSKWRWHDVPEVNARIQSQGRIRDNFREYAEQELTLGHGHTVDAWNMARLADANLVCLDGGVRVVWGPCPRKPPADEDLEAAEEALRTLWREKVAVPAYNYPSYHGHMTYVPWCEWRAAMTPKLDQECFASDHAAIMERIWASKGKEEETEEDEE